MAERYLHSASHGNEAELAFCVKLANPKGGPVLDVATGPGHTAFAFAPYASRVVATDITPEMLEVAAREAAKRGLKNIETRIAAAEDLPFPAESFEGVTCRVAPHHFRDTEQFLLEVRRVLIPGGWFLLVDTVGIDDPFADEALGEIEFERDPSHVRNYTAYRWLTMVAAAGLDVEHHETIPRPHNVVAWLDRMNVEEPARSRIIDLIGHSNGWLKEYLRPHGFGDDLTFHLHQITLLARKPS